MTTDPPWWWQADDYTITSVTPGFGTVNVRVTDRSGRVFFFTTPKKDSDRESLDKAIRAVMATHPPAVATP